MELIFELLFELIFEGSLEIGTSKKVSMPIRIVVMTVFFIVVGGFLTLLLLIALSVMKSSVILGWLFILFDLFMFGGIMYAIWKRVKKKKFDFINKRKSSMDHIIWDELYKRARAVQNGRKISDYVEAGGVAASILSVSGNIYTGVCVDTCSTLGICAERNAIFNMLTNGEHEIKKVLAILPNGKTGAPCGACRELMVQLMPDDYDSIEIMLDYERRKIVTLGELTPEWWI